MDAVQKLSELFREFPGIGHRQAKRFVYFLLSKNPAFLDELSKQISFLPKIIRICQNCFRFFPAREVETVACDICLDNSRDKKTLMVVARNEDAETIEKNAIYRGYYFVLGNEVPILEEHPEKLVRAKEFLNVLEKRIGLGLKEIILAFNANPTGENTATYVTLLAKPYVTKSSLSVTHLGKGLSTGLELEYSDPETLRGALKNRG